jgi:hypothetical protein
MFAAGALSGPARALGQALPLEDAPLEDAMADDAEPARPALADTSLWTGRTLPRGHAAMAAGVGWPGLFVELALAPTERWNVGGRVQVNYGSPLMGIASGIGGDVQLPARYRFFTDGDVDVALALRPGFTFGQGALVGLEGSASNDFGWAARLDAGVLVGVRTSDTTTVGLGALLGGGLSGDPEGRLTPFGCLYANVALELVVSADTLLFLSLESGYGLARAGTFGTALVFRLWLGLAYEL